MRDLIKENWFFHYTNAQGLQGILESCSFWGTDANYLNDFKEIQLGVEYAHHWLDTHRSEFIDKYGISSANKLGNNMDPRPGFQSGQRMFICSFSTEIDSLSQWRAYGAENGYALGIHYEYMKRKAKKLGLTIEQCIYDHDYENNPVSSFLDGLYSSDYFDNFEDTKLCDVCIGIMRNSIILKGKAFEQEKEWRLFPDDDFSKKNRNLQKFRIKKGVFVPYINFKIFPNSESEKYIKTSEESRCPVLRIMIGPSSHNELARDGLGKLLRDYQKEYSFLSPELSSVTYRDW